MKFDVSLGRARGEAADRCVHDWYHVDRSRFECERSRVESCEQQQVGDEAVEAPRLREDHGGRALRVDGLVGQRLRVALYRCHWCA